VIAVHAWVKQWNCSDLSEWRPPHLPAAVRDGRLASSSRGAREPANGILESLPQHARPCSRWPPMWSVFSCTRLSASSALGRGAIRPPATAARRAVRGALYLGHRRYTWAAVLGTAAHEQCDRPCGPTLGRMRPYVPASPPLVLVRAHACHLARVRLARESVVYHAGPVELTSR
jgi:hypothetical protein